MMAFGCATIPYSRLLDNNIRSVYVTMLRNDAYEPGVEEDLTRSLQEIFIEDGRIAVTREKQADMLLEGKVNSYKIAPRGFEADEFAWYSIIEITAEVTAYDPYDYDRQFPLGTWKGITIRHEYISDTRRIKRLTETDDKKLALKRLAQRIFTRVMYSRPDDIEKIREKRDETIQAARVRERQIQFRSAYAPE
ncbi:MAG: LPS assembly lipoprotein LptE [Candidatus Sumerlaeota bacterium]|nr:LPS assembly lipoprotein LptE [Candidatus Sumerlaeota bacterium]